MIATVLKVLALLFVLAVGVSLMLPSVTRGREAARRTQCKNNLKQILLAIHNYHDQYHAFPPAYTTDGEGNRLHSWRTLILPYLDQPQLYKTIDLSKPWNHPANAHARRAFLPCYCCPSAWPTEKSSEWGHLTPYLAVVTQDSCLRGCESADIDQITDGTANTLMVIEVTPEQGVHWMEPVDANAQTVLTFGSIQKRPHIGGAHSALADGSVRFLGINVPQDTLMALMTTAAGDTVGDF
jgi:hypothetical protein